MSLQTKLRNFIEQRKTRYALAGLLALAILGGIAHQVWAASQQGPTGSEPLEASGVIHVETISIASEFGGRVAEIPVREGDAVAAGDLLVQLDTALLDARIEAMEALVAQAEAGLAQARAGARPGQVAIAQAQLAQAEVGHAAAQQAVSDTVALVANPQQIDLEIAVTQAQLEAAQHRTAQAVAIKDGVEVAKSAIDAAYAEWNGGGRFRVLVASGATSDLMDQLPAEIRELLPDEIDISNPPPGTYAIGDWEVHITAEGVELYKYITVSFPLEAQLLPNTWWQTWVGVSAATAEEEGLEATLAQLYAQRERPLELEAAAGQAAGALAEVEAQIAAAEAQVGALQAGASEEQIAALEARVAQARQGLEALLTQRSMMSIESPTDGVVVDLFIHPGEVAAQGAAMAAVADLSEVILTVYVPETLIGHVWLGQPVQVTVDSFPDRIFEGRVSYISDQAEFTPRNVATQEERVNLVFAVDILLPNEDGALKPGMPADAALE
jgi:multidrug resistance efflux pump